MIAKEILRLLIEDEDQHLTSNANDDNDLKRLKVESLIKRNDQDNDENDENDANNKLKELKEP